MKTVTRGFNNSIAYVVRRGYESTGPGFLQGITGLGSLSLGDLGIGLLNLTRRIKRYVRGGLGG